MNEEDDSAEQKIKKLEAEIMDLRFAVVLLGCTILAYLLSHLPDMFWEFIYAR